MRTNIFRVTIIALAMATVAAGSLAAQQTPDASQGQSGQGQGSRRWRGGMGEFPGGGGGVLGTVTEITSEHYTIKTDTGDVYTVHFSVNTRIVKQPAGLSGQNRRQSSENFDPDAPRPQPQTLKSTEIKVGDIITAGGELDATKKSIGAVFIALVDPERAKQMKEMQANYGKTWLAGRITAIDGLTITIQGMDKASHLIAVDENTSFHERRDSITLADLHPGETLRAEGSAKGNAFLATQINASQPRNQDGGAPPVSNSAAPAGKPN